MTDGNSTAVAVVPTPEARAKAVAEFAPGAAVADMRRVHGSEVDRWLATTVDAHDDAKVAHAYAVGSLLIEHPSLVPYLTLEIWDAKGNVTQGALGSHPAMVSLVADAARWRAQKHGGGEPQGSKQMTDEQKAVAGESQDAFDARVGVLMLSPAYRDSGDPRHRVVQAEVAALFAARYPGGHIGPGLPAGEDYEIGPGTGIR